ncbi:hypothetical protein D3C72_2267460 [compost metagenome]
MGDKFDQTIGRGIGKPFLVGERNDAVVGREAGVAAGVKTFVATVGVVLLPMHF